MSTAPPMPSAAVTSIVGPVTATELVVGAENAYQAARKARTAVIRLAGGQNDPEPSADEKRALREIDEQATIAIMSAADGLIMAKSLDRVTDDEYEALANRIIALDPGSSVHASLKSDAEATAAYEADLREHPPGIVPVAHRTSVPNDIDDSHMAQAFANEIMGRYLYVAAQNRWRRWDGRRWASDDMEAIHEEARLWVLDLGKTMFDTGADSAKLKKVASYRSRSRLEAVVTLARRIQGIAAAPDEFDCDPDVLNVGNGIVDLRTGLLAPHDPEKRLSKITPVNYRPDAEHADIEQLLDVVAGDVREYLVALLGYAATGHTSEDVIPVFDGAGANGKSSLLEAVAAAMGDYAAPAAPQLIMKTAHDEHPTIKADLQGRRVVFISETEENGSLRMEQVKSLTGGDRIKARVMRGDYFDFTPTHTLIVATNHRPFVKTTEHAAWRRLRLVPFPFTYKRADQAEPGDRIQDPKLRARLTTGRQQREAMLAWIVAGAVSWYKVGLPKSATIEVATDEWRSSEDVILRFIEEELTFTEGAEIRGRELYTLYSDWCRHEGRPPKSNKNFATDFMTHQAVRDAAVAKLNVSNVAIYRGVGKAQ